VARQATYALTHRTVLRKLFLTPLTPLVHLGVMYALGSALRAHGATLNHAVIMPNHFHGIITTAEDNLPAIKRDFYSEAAKFIKVALAEHGFEPPERVFAAGAGHHMRLVNAGAQLVYLHYQDMNPVAANLVGRVEQYPGVVTDLGLLKGRNLEIERPPLYFDARYRDERLVIPVATPPVLESVMGADKVVYHLRRARRTKEAELAARRTRAPMGALAVARQHPWREPKSPRRIQKGPKPTYMVVGDEALRIHCAKETTRFHERHEESRQAHLRGEAPSFPAGTYLMRVQHRAKVEAVDPLYDVLAAPDRFVQERLASETPESLLHWLGGASREVDEEDVHDDLAIRLDEARADEVDRRAPATDDPVTVAAPSDADPDAGDAELSKRVVLRGSTAAARKRRRKARRARRADKRAERPWRRRRDQRDLDPPPE
jgi:hypothetical protein